MKSLPNIFICNILTRKVVTLHTTTATTTVAVVNVTLHTTTAITVTVVIVTWHTSRSLYSLSGKTVAWDDFYYQCADKYDGSSMVEVFSLI